MLVFNFSFTIWFRINLRNKSVITDRQRQLGRAMRPALTPNYLDNQVHQALITDYTIGLANCQ